MRVGGPYGRQHTQRARSQVLAIQALVVVALLVLAFILFLRPGDDTPLFGIGAPEPQPPFDARIGGTPGEHGQRGERGGERGAGPGSKKVRQGTVVSSAAEKTITVRIEVARRHPVYTKVVRRTATIHAHDEANEASAGDVVRVVESRPLSRTKRWRLVEVLERAR